MSAEPNRIWAYARDWEGTDLAASHRPPPGGTAVEYVRRDVVAALVRAAFEHLDHVPGLVYTQAVGDLKTAALYLGERFDEVPTSGRIGKSNSHREDHA